MPRNQQIAVQNTFARGLITEATGLSFPEGACTDTDNCIFSRTGTVRRRLGFDFEDRYDTTTTDIEGSVVISYVWQNVSGQGDLSFAVVQVGDELSFYKVLSDSPLSQNKHSFTVDLTDFVPAGVSTVATLECQFSSGNGLLFVTNPNLDSFYITYDTDTDNFSNTALDLMIRDFKGDTTDANAIDGRPTSTVAGLSAAHKYNLKNQGWTDANLAAWDTARTDMPSNADVNWYFKNSTDVFDFSTVGDRAVGNSPAPKGHYIYSFYDIDRNANVTGATSESIDTERMTTSAFFDGRVFYSGLRVASQSAEILFTQIVQSPEQYEMCYQTNDPSSETLFDLLPSDGGVINIIDAGTIYKMIPALNALLIFASNGVWALTGSQGSGFKATDYAIAKISSVRSISHASFLDVEGIPFFWNLDGIYTVTADPQTNSLRVVCITDTTIKTFYNEILGESKQYARGVYDAYTKRVHWLYRSSASVGFSDKYKYDQVLSFNILTNCFFPWSIDISNVRIHAIIDIISVGGSFVESAVTDSAVAVTDGGDPVTVFASLSSSSIDSIVKYLVSYNDTDDYLTFAEEYKDTYLDWESFDDVGVSYDSFFITGFKILGQGILKFQQNYVNVFSDNTTDNSYVIRGIWDYGSNTNSNRWTIPQTFTFVADDFSVKNRRIKIRGNGLACQFKVYSNEDFPFEILGWSLFETGNKWP